MLTSPGTGSEYDSIAKNYDFFTAPFLKSTRKHISEIAGNLGLKRIIDICCGTGTQCILLEEEGFDVTGVDLSEAMLDVAGKNSPGRIEYLCADARELPIADAGFDGAIFSLALHEKPPDERGTFLQEARRVLKENGKLIIADYAVRSGFKARLMGVAVALVERLAGREHYRNYRHYMKAGALEGLLGANGLVSISSRKFLGGTVNVVVAQWLR